MRHARNGDRRDLRRAVIRINSDLSRAWVTSECLELGVSAAFKWDVIGPVGTLSMLAPE